jgi:hypothetical protein
MPGLLNKILPHEATFFVMFSKQAENVQEGAKAMVEMLEHFGDPAAGAEKIKAIEHAGDLITHDIMTRLNQTFITPFDREDIHELASTIDDVLDLIDAVAARLVMYHIATVKPGVVDLAKSVEINRLENQADRQCRDLLADLFDQEKDPIQIIKWKEIIETLEFAADKCEDVANVIEGVTLKNA